MVEVALSTDLALILLAATLVGFLAKQTGQPTIVAYIAAGLFLGPAVLGIVTPGELTETIAELGLAFLLFLLGIKMRIDDIRHVLRPIVLISIPQMVLVFLVGLGTALLIGFSLLEGTVIGLAVMYSSTAVVVKSLTDKDEATSLHGKIDVGVLLVQDIVVVILLAVLAAGRPDNLVEIATTLVIVLVLTVAIVILALGASRTVLPVIFRRIADNREIFFLIAISWLFLFVFISDNINLFLAPFGVEAYMSIEMGAFLAGLAIAQLPYSKELQGYINPLTDLFVMIFFVTVALYLDPNQLFAYTSEALIAAAILMPAKFIIFFVLIDWQRFSLETTFLGSINMVQISEFGIIVTVIAVEGGFIDPGILGFITLLALFTMGLSVYFIEFNHHIFDRLEPVLSWWATDEPYHEGTREYRDHAVVVGYDDVTQNAISILAQQYDDVVIIDRTVRHIETAEREGYDTIYGDAQNSTIRKDARLKQASFVLSSSVQLDVNKTLLESVGQDTIVFAEAKHLEHASELYAAGAHCVILPDHFAAELLADALELFMSDPDGFESFIDDQLGLLEETSPFSEADLWLNMYDPQRGGVHE